MKMPSSLLRIVEHFAGRIPAYRRLLRKLRTLEDFQTLPLQTRETLRAFLDGGVAAPAFNITATSGSTSSRLLVVHSRRAYEVHIRRLVKLYRRAGLEPGALCLNLCSYEFNSGGRMMESAMKAAGVGVIPAGSPGSLRQMKEAVELVRQLKPQWVNAYTNQLFDLFSLLGRRHSVNHCLVNGELLWPAYRRRMEAMGRCRIHDHYGAMEVSGFAVDPAGDREEMEVFSDGLFLEILGPDGQASREGTGDLLVTDQANTCMPFIRYRLGDRVELFRNGGKWRVRVLGRAADSMLVNGVVVMKKDVVRITGDFLGHPKFFFTLGKHPATYRDRLTLCLPAADMPRAGTLTGMLISSTGMDPVIEARAFDGEPPRTVNGKLVYFVDGRDRLAGR